MIVFSPIAPEFFQSQIGYGALSFTKNMYVFNLLSYDIRFPRIDRLIPDTSRISEYAMQNDDSEIFEQEYFTYLDTSEPAFLDLMNILTKEYNDGSNLIIIETIMNSQFCDSVVSSLMKYLYTRYGVKPLVVQDIEDLDNINIANSVFSPEGLRLIDHDLYVLSVICPEMVAADTEVF